MGPRCGHHNLSAARTPALAGAMRRQDSEDGNMSEEMYPGWYSLIKEKHEKFIKALEQLGEAVRQEGPLDEKTSNLVQLAAAATNASEGAVHSHVRRALKAGATQEE